MAMFRRDKKKKDDGPVAMARADEDPTGSVTAVPGDMEVVYLSKIARWREHGFDVDELEDMVMEGRFEEFESTYPEVLKTQREGRANDGPATKVAMDDGSAENAPDETGTGEVIVEEEDMAAVGGDDLGEGEFEELDVDELAPEADEGPVLEGTSGDSVHGPDDLDDGIAIVGEDSYIGDGTGHNPGPRADAVSVDVSDLDDYLEDPADGDGGAWGEAEELDPMAEVDWGYDDHAGDDSNGAPSDEEDGEHILADLVDVVGARPRPKRVPERAEAMARGPRVEVRTITQDELVAGRAPPGRRARPSRGETPYVEAERVVPEPEVDVDALREPEVIIAERRMLEAEGAGKGVAGAIQAESRLCPTCNSVISHKNALETCRECGKRGCATCNDYELTHTKVHVFYRYVYDEPLCFACYEKDTAIQNMIAKGLGCLGNGNYTYAEEYLRSAMRLDPESVYVEKARRVLYKVRRAKADHTRELAGWREDLKKRQNGRDSPKGPPREDEDIVWRGRR